MINTSLETEKAHSLAKVIDDRGLFAWGLGLCELDSTACLKLIDPYADTIFDQPQLPALLAELRAAKATIIQPQLELAKQKYLEGWRTPPEAFAKLREYVDSFSLADIHTRFDRISDIVRDAIDRGPPIRVRFTGD